MLIARAGRSAQRRRRRTTRHGGRARSGRIRVSAVVGSLPHCTDAIVQAAPDAAGWSGVRGVLLIDDVRGGRSTPRPPTSPNRGDGAGNTIPLRRDIVTARLFAPQPARHRTHRRREYLRTWKRRHGAPYLDRSAYRADATWSAVLRDHSTSPSTQRIGVHRGYCDGRVTEAAGVSTTSATSGGRGQRFVWTPQPSTFSSYSQP
jgi:hypothetical protein